MSSRIFFLVGNGRRVKLWKDKRCATASFSFPSLFLFAVLLFFWNSFVQGEGGWSPYFSKPFNDWEMESVERFFLCLHGLRVYRDEGDRMFWIEIKYDKFTMKLLYAALERGTLISFPWSII